MPTDLSYIAASPLAGCLTDLQADRQASAATALLRCPADFPGFAGHFPDQPVLPAVLQLLAVRLLAESLLETRLTPVGADRLKFKGMVGPDETVNLRVSLREQAGLLKVEFSLDKAGTPIASGTLVFRPIGEER
jgi:3-hydroxyacyl-[acyl-carrier-protein] dehydratase